jgi:cobyrinic acid a,c-diamide synthase
MSYADYPRVVIAGLSGDSGKTLVSCGLIRCLRERGLEVSAFKKGPDYIDPAWLSLASHRPARNLDTYLMGFSKARESFLRKGSPDGFNVIEGNRGLFDGVDVSGTHSTAELAKLLKAPVIIVQNVSKVTRTAAASILGCVELDSEIRVAGVILNNVANERHAKLVGDAIEDATGIPVLGSIPRLSGKFVLPSRHLGLITPGEFERSLLFLREARSTVEGNVDVARIIAVAKSAPVLECESVNGDENNSGCDGGSRPKVRIAYFKDESFSFYYPENLEMLEAAGAELIPISPARGTLRGELDALYIGGGFPEMNLTTLISNREMISAVKSAAEDGLPIYAECGGLIYLAESIEWNGREYSLSGVLPIKVSMDARPQGHGYCEAFVDRDNPFFELGTVIRGHEFHYSKIVEHHPEIETSFALSRGVGCFEKRDGLTYKNVFASYMHLHATSCPEWASGVVSVAEKYKKSKKAGSLAFV